MGHAEKLLSWPKPTAELGADEATTRDLENAIARGVIRGGLWLIGIIGAIALVLAVSNYGFSKFVSNWNEPPRMRGY